MYKPSKQARAEFVQERAKMQRQNRRLAERGLPTLPVPKLKELSSPREMRKWLNKIYEYRESGRAFVKTAREYEKRKEEQEQKKRQERKERERAKRRERYQREKQRREELDNYLEVNEHALQMWEYLKDEYGLTIKSLSELKQWYAYLNKRNAMRSRKAFYEFDKYVDDFATLKEKGYTRPAKFDELMRDFDAFVSDQTRLRENMESMSLKYGASLIDQVYSDYLGKLEEQAERKAKREKAKQDRSRKDKGRNKKE